MYLKIAQTLESYGVSCLDAMNKQGNVLCLRVSALGLAIYERERELLLFYGASTAKLISTRMRQINHLV